MLKTTAADGGVATLRYDTFGRQLGAIDELGRETVTTYDRMNHVTKVRHMLSEERYAYDELGHRRQEQIAFTPTGGSERVNSTDTLFDTRGLALQPHAINPLINYVASCAGSKSSTRNPSIGMKCLTFAVSSDSPCSSAVAAISASARRSPSDRECWSIRRMARSPIDSMTGTISVPRPFNAFLSRAKSALSRQPCASSM